MYCVRSVLDCSSQPYSEPDCCSDTVLSGLEAVTQLSSGISDRLPNHLKQTMKENTPIRVPH